MNGTMERTHTLTVAMTAMRLADLNGNPVAYLQKIQIQDPLDEDNPTTFFINHLTDVVRIIARRIRTLKVEGKLVLGVARTNPDIVHMLYHDIENLFEAIIKKLKVMIAKLRMMNRIQYQRYVQDLVDEERVLSYQNNEAMISIQLVKRA